MEARWMGFSFWLNISIPDIFHGAKNKHLF